MDAGQKEPSERLEKVTCCPSSISTRSGTKPSVPYTTTATARPWDGARAAVS